MLNRFSGPARVRVRMQSTKILNRNAITLIELLIVMGILTILATVSLATVKGLLKDQKVTRAAQLVEQYIESARVRALTNRRPVAVFLERSAVVGNAGAPVLGNYTVTRLTIGEVFPPYTGDVLNVSGQLGDVNTDGFADQVTFIVDDVVSGFGSGVTQPGFLQGGDLLEFDGYEGRLPITGLTYLAGSTSPPIPPKVVVAFANPPLIPGTTLGLVPPALPIPATGRSVGFRAYRRPSKSLVGAITMPRGTCVDLAASGFGPAFAGAADEILAGSPPAPVAVSQFALTGPPMSSRGPRDFSRIALLFSESGRLSGCYRETRIGGSSAFFELLPSQVLHLMVGRTEQVLPVSDAAADLSTPRNRKRALIQRSPQEEADPVRSNLMDPANVWIVCNPFTGEIKSAPVTQVPDATLSAAVNALASEPANETEFAVQTASAQNVVRAARALARSGMREQL